MGFQPFCLHYFGDLLQFVFLQYGFFTIGKNLKERNVSWQELPGNYDRFNFILWSTVWSPIFSRKLDFYTSKCLLIFVCKKKKEKTILQIHLFGEIIAELLIYAYQIRNPNVVAYAIVYNKLCIIHKRSIRSTEK